MGYCAVTDVQGDFKGIVFSSSTTITDTVVTQFIVEASALMDSYLAQRYIVPVESDDSSLALMSLYCRTLVSDRIKAILETKQATNTDANASVKGDRFTTADVIKALVGIKNGDMALTGANLINVNASFYSNNAARNEQPRFRKDSKQW